MQRFKAYEHMKQRGLILVKLFLIFFIFFIFSKIVFLLYHWNQTIEAGISNLAPIFWHGLRLDISAVSYLLLLPLVWFLICTVFKIKIYYKAVNWYFVIVLILLSLIIAIDIELYKFWGFRLDMTSTMYLKIPKEAFASVSFWLILRQLIFAGIIFYLFYKIYHRLNKNQDFIKFSFLEIPLYLLLIGFLVIPLRGGLGIAPINVGSAYFSQNNYLNHAAINVFWNLGNSSIENVNTTSYQNFTGREVENILKPYLNSQDTSGVKLLTIEKPNIIIIMLESFTANVIEPLGGLPDVTPNLNNLSKEGVFFTNFYASGDRSDKGLVSILSGFPAQPTFSVIKDVAKSQLLPKLPLDLKSNGYQTAFYYGGDLNFANMRSYLITSGFSKLISKDDFPKNTYNSKWGSHDDVVFNRLTADLDTAKTPFFKMIFTLSSHEPFEVPVKRFKGEGEVYKFLNSICYTDSCLGDFVQKAKTKAWWENSLVIIVADHGVRWPHKIKNHVPGKFLIPMLWIGGAVDTSFSVNKVASQIDIPVTVLNQLGYDTKMYKYSRNIFADSHTNDAFYAYNNGVGMVNDSMKLVYDFNLKSTLLKKGKVDKNLINISKAYIQSIYNELNKIK